MVPAAPGDDLSGFKHFNEKAPMAGGKPPGRVVHVERDASSLRFVHQKNKPSMRRSLEANLSISSGGICLTTLIVFIDDLRDQAVIPFVHGIKRVERGFPALALIRLTSRLVAPVVPQRTLAAASFQAR